MSEQTIHAKPPMQRAMEERMDVLRDSIAEYLSLASTAFESKDYNEAYKWAGSAFRSLGLLGEIAHKYAQLSRWKGDEKYLKSKVQP